MGFFHRCLASLSQRKTTNIAIVRLPQIQPLFFYSWAEMERKDFLRENSNKWPIYPIPCRVYHLYATYLCVLLILHWAKNTLMGTKRIKIFCRTLLLYAYKYQGTNKTTLVPRHPCSIYSRTSQLLHDYPPLFGSLPSMLKIVRWGLQWKAPIAFPAQFIQRPWKTQVAVITEDARLVTFHSFEAVAAIIAPIPQKQKRKATICIPDMFHGCQSTSSGFFCCNGE